MDTNIARQVLEEHADFVGARHLVSVDGLSSPRVCNLLNQLVMRMAADEQYLEVGTWKGRTLLSAAFRNYQRVCIGCDRFRVWGRFTGPGALVRRALHSNIQRYQKECARIELHEMPSQRLFDEGHLRPPIGVYFYDGDHSYSETFHGVVAAVPFLAERSVLLVDDWNDPVIRCATREAIESAGLKLLWHRALPGHHDESAWWNGLGVYWLGRPTR